MHRPGAHLDVERLLQETAARGPELRQLEDQLLQRDHSIQTGLPGSTLASSPDARGVCPTRLLPTRAWRISRSTRADFSSFSRCRLSSRRCTVSSSRDARALKPRVASRPAPIAPAAARKRSAAADKPIRPPARTSRQSRHVIPRRHHRPATRRASGSPASLREQPGPARRARQRRIDPLQPQHPVLEVARQRLDRRAGRHRIDDRRTQPVEPLVGLRLGRPLVDQLGEVADVPERPAAIARHAGQAATAAARRS